MIGSTEPGGPAEAIAALGRQVDRLQTAVAEADLPGLRRDVHHLAVALAGLADQIAELADAGAPARRPVSWLAPTPDPDPAGDGAGGGEGDPASGLSASEWAGLLEGLAGWAGQVYGWYADGRLPDCWLWHPDVVEELLWLWQAWQAAYHGQDASVQRAADWHDRHRPGVARRLRAAAGGCSLHNHLDPSPPPAAPAADAVGPIAGWWATDRSQPAPAPTREQIDAADHTRAAAPGRYR